MIGGTIGHYTILEKIGEGGMGQVWLAEDTRLERRVAIKLLPHHAAQDEDEKARFMQEAKAAARLTHPNIAQVHEIGEEDGRLYIVMEYIDGGSFSDRLEEVKQRCLPLDEILEWMKGAADGLAEAHREGVIHRDIKPDNLMLTRSGHVKITDFGLARLETATRLTASGATLGTINYMSPEQVVGREVDSRADLFSLGATFYELLTGYQPFEGADAAAIYYSILHDVPDPIYRYRRDVDPLLDQIVMKLLEKDPQLRYQHADEVVADLKRISIDLTTSRPSARPAPVRRTGFLASRSRGGRTFTGVAAGFLLALVVVAVWYFGFGPGSGGPYQGSGEDSADIAATMSSTATLQQPPSTENERALQTIVSYLEQMSALSRRVDSLQTLLTQERAVEEEAGVPDVGIDATTILAELQNTQSERDSIMAVLRDERAERLPAQAVTEVKSAGEIEVLLPVPESTVSQSLIDVRFNIKPAGRIGRLTMALDKDVVFTRQELGEGELQLTEKIDLMTSGRHLIDISMESEDGGCSEEHITVFLNPISEKRSVGVLDLDYINVDPGEAKAISERLRAYLARQDLFEVIGYSRMEAIMEDVGFQLSGACDTDECVVQVGKILGAREMVAGSVSRVGSIYSLQVRLIDIDNSRIEGEAFKDVTGIEEVLTIATDEISKDLVDMSLKAAPVAEETRTPSTDSPFMVGVLDLSAHNVSESETRAITERMRLYLNRQELFQVVERNKMITIMEEMGFQFSGSCDTDECVMQVGRILGSRKMIAGSVSKVGNLYSIQVRVLDSETSRIEADAFVDKVGIEAILSEGTSEVAEKIAAYYSPG